MYRSSFKNIYYSARPIVTVFERNNKPYPKNAAKNTYKRDYRSVIAAFFVNTAITRVFSNDYDIVKSALRFASKAQSQILLIGFLFIYYYYY